MRLVPSRCLHKSHPVTHHAGPPDEPKSKATYLIYQSCGSIPQFHVVDEEDPAKMWSILEDLFSGLTKTYQSISQSTYQAVELR